MVLHLLNISWIAVTRPRSRSRNGARTPSADTTVTLGTSIGGLTKPAFSCAPAGSSCSHSVAARAIRMSRRVTKRSGLMHRPEKSSLLLFVWFITLLQKVAPQIEAFTIVEHVTRHLAADDDVSRIDPGAEQPAKARSREPRWWPTAALTKLGQCKSIQT